MATAIATPQLGDIAKTRNLGWEDKSHKVIWQACKHCGKERWVALIKGEPRVLVCKSCRNYNGGRNRDGYGYIRVYVYPDDFFYQMADKQHYVREHRLVMARHLGRNLHSWEIVHHKNHIRDDNRIENLQLVSDDRHKQITILEKRIKYLERRVLLLESEAILLKTDKEELIKGGL